MNATTALAVLAGVVLGVGLWLAFVRLPIMRRTTFTERVAPQLRSADRRSRLLADEERAVTPFGPLAAFRTVETALAALMALTTVETIGGTGETTFARGTFRTLGTRLAHRRGQQERGVTLQLTGQRSGHIQH